jgi:AcrR family transcriptional regulator
LDAAAEVFEARGFAGANLSDILSRAGVTKGAMYFHFASKEELANAIIEEQWNFDIPTVSGGGDALQGLIDLSHAFGHGLATNIRVRASNRLVGEATFDSPPALAYQRWLEIIDEYLHAAQAAGDIRSELDPAQVTYWIGGSFLGIQTMSGILSKRTDLRERITDLWRFSLPGLVPPRRLSRFDPAGRFHWDEGAA